MTHERCAHCGDKLSHGLPGDPRKLRTPPCQRPTDPKARIRIARARTEARRAAREEERLELQRSRETISARAPMAPAAG